MCNLNQKSIDMGRIHIFEKRRKHPKLMATVNTDLLPKLKLYKYEEKLCNKVLSE